jgi:hypothetical protein
MDMDMDKYEVDVALPTMRRHLQIIRQLQAFIDREGDEVRGLQEWMRAIHEKYAHPSTQRTIFGLALGAIKRCHIYRTSFCNIQALRNILLNKMKILETRMRIESDLLLPATTKNQMSTTMNWLTTYGTPQQITLAALLILTSHRGANILSLQARDMVLMSNPGPKTLADDPIRELTVTALDHSQRSTNIGIVFRKHKTMRYVGTYAIHIAVPFQLAQVFAECRMEAEASQSHLPPHKRLLFHGPMADLKKVQRMLPYRETRRAILRTLAWEQQLTPEQLLLFSRHTGIKQLRTYLSSGLLLGDEAMTTLPASLATINEVL